MKKIVTNFSCVILSIILSVVFIEIGLRIAGIGYPFPQIYDKTRGIRLRPNLERWYNVQGGFYMETNSLGYRDVQHAIAKPSNTFRIAVVGDSYVEAREVSQKESAWKLLGNNLVDCPDLNGRKIETLTFGVGGYGTVQEFLTIKMHVMQFKPDLVLLAFTTSNDLGDNSKAYQVSIRNSGNTAMSPYYVREGEKFKLDRSFRNFSFLNLARRIILTSGHYSRVLQVISRARNVIVGKLLSNNSEHDLAFRHAAYRPPKNDMWKDSWAVTEDVLLMIKRYVENDGGKFALAILTDEIQVDIDSSARDRFAEEIGVPDLYYAERRLKRFGKNNDFPVFPLAFRFREVVERTGIKMHRSTKKDWGGHWNQNGHRLAGKILAEDICAGRLLQ